MLATDPDLDVVANEMLDKLRVFLPASTGGLPASTVSLASLAEKAVGIGRHRGSDLDGSFPISRKGIRLDALARFQLWGSDADEIDRVISELNSLLMAQRENLRTVGFLQLSLEDTPPAQPFLDTAGGWRRYADYRALYEFDYTSSDGAASLIARIPVQMNGELNQSMTITDEMTRWDNKSAPTLSVRGAATVSGLSLLVFVPGAPPAGPVTFIRTYDGAPGTPTAYANLTKFMAAVSGNNAVDRNAKFTFPSFVQFRNAFKNTGATIALGDWNNDGVPDQYQPAALTIDPPIGLPTVRDRFEATYDSGQKFNRVGVAYLRAI